MGAGMAGLSIARSFIGGPHTVWVVESGGLESSADSQSLYEGGSIGEPGIRPAECRLRTFGGACNLWGGGCAPLDSTVSRDWVPHSGWPFPYSEMEPHYRRAGTWLGLGSLDFTQSGFLVAPGRAPLQFDASLLRNQICATSALLPGLHLREVFGNATNVHVLLHANVLELEATSGGTSIQRARIAALRGPEGHVHAASFVLACGGIENARLLLLSSSVLPRGLGNQHDLVGRYFMDHPSGRIGTIDTDRPEVLTRPYARPPTNTGIPVRPEITLAGDVQRKHRILSARVRPFAVEALVPGGIRALRELRCRIARRRWDEGATLHHRICLRHNGEPLPPQSGTGSTVFAALRTALGSADLAKAFVRRLSGGSTVPTNRVDLVAYFEQAPNPRSRVTLGSELDELGQRRVCVDWRMTALDLHTHRTAAMVFGEQLARACGGSFRPEPALLEPDGVLQLAGTSHHLGTTRMAADARDGVVDPDCRVHGIANLYCAGSSVFPSGGWAFPTFAIVALAARLAEHLQRQLSPTAATSPAPASMRDCTDRACAQADRA